MFIRKEAIAKYILFTIFFVSPIMVTIYELFASLVTYPLYFLLIYYILFEAKKYRLSGDFYIVSILIFIPILLSLTIGTLTSVLTSPHGIDHSGLLKDSLGRLVNYLGFFFILYSSYIFLINEKECSFQKTFFYKLLKAYWLGALVLVAFGLWHAISMYSGFIPFPFEGMRTNIHGTGGNVEIAIAGVKRLTGICEEPSYFAPILLDFVLISLLLFHGTKRNIFVLIGLVLLLLSFSAGGYFNVALIMFFTFIICYFDILKNVIINKKLNLKFIYITIMALSPFFILIPYMLELGLLNIILERLPHIFDIEKHSRLYMVVKPFEYIFDSNILNILFGHGIKSFYLLKEAFLLPNGTPFHITSNNIFTDFLWEHGIVGLLAIVYLFIFLAKSSLSLLNNYKYITFALVIHIFLTSLYRGDYASSRFVILIIIILFMINISKKENKL